MLPGKKIRLSDEEKLDILKEYLNSSITKTALQEKYELGHCTIDRWLKKYGLTDKTNHHHNTRKKKAERIRRVLDHNRKMELLVEETQQELHAERAKNRRLESMLDRASEMLGFDLRTRFAEP